MFKDHCPLHVNFWCFVISYYGQALFVTTRNSSVIRRCVIQPRCRYTTKIPCTKCMETGLNWPFEIGLILKFGNCQNLGRWIWTHCHEVHALLTHAKIKKTYLEERGLLLGDDHLILRGGGGLALLVGTDYLFSSRARPENLFPGKPRTEYFFQPQ